MWADPGPALRFLPVKNRLLISAVGICSGIKHQITKTIKYKNNSFSSKNSSKTGANVQSDRSLLMTQQRGRGPAGSGLLWLDQNSVRPATPRPPTGVSQGPPSLSGSALINIRSLAWSGTDASPPRALGDAARWRLTKFGMRYASDRCFAIAAQTPWWDIDRSRLRGRADLGGGPIKLSERWSVKTPRPYFSSAAAL